MAQRTALLRLARPRRARQLVPARRRHAGRGAVPQASGSLLQHEKLIEFIGRNYEHDDAGQWFFQNGPQRVYVELEATPIVWRIAPADFALSTHSGQDGQQPSACLLDEDGKLYLAAPMGLGLVHTLDMGIAADAVEQGRWQPQEVRRADLPARFGYVMSPAARRAGAS